MIYLILAVVFVATTWLLGMVVMGPMMLLLDWDGPDDSSKISFHTEVFMVGLLPMIIMVGFML